MFWIVLAGLSAATAGPESPQVAPTSVARVLRNVVVYGTAPKVRVTVPPSAHYLGADRFLLNGTNDCEIHIFVDADAQRRIHRFYWVHFESILPSDPDDRMHYSDTDQKSSFWGSTVWASTEPALMTRTPRVGSDTERFRAIIRNAGYSLPPNMATVRLVRLLDDPKSTGLGRREVMLLYGEDMAPRGLTFEQVSTAGRPNEKWKASERPLVRRAVASFNLIAR